jgi:hypothetical protein
MERGCMGLTTDDGVLEMGNGFLIYRMSWKCDTPCFGSISIDGHAPVFESGCIYPLIFNPRANLESWQEAL